MSNKSKLKKKEEAIIRLDFGCGKNKLEGFTGVDLYAPGADIRQDLFKFPYLWKNDSVTEIHASHFVEHIPRELRWPFFVECYRILKPDGVMRIVVPSWKSERSLGDMTHEFPPVVAMAFFYLNKAWREANNLNYGPYDLKCNFEHQAGPTAMSPAFANRNHETQVFACTHYLESFGDMWAVLTKKPM